MLCMHNEGFGRSKNRSAQSWVQLIQKKMKIKIKGLPLELDVCCKRHATCRSPTCKDFDLGLSH